MGFKSEVIGKENSDRENREWISEAFEEAGEEVKHEEEMVKRIREGLRKVLEENQKLTANDCCKLPNSEYKVRFIDPNQEPVYTRSRPIRKDEYERTMETIMGWIEKGWIRKLDKPNKWYSSVINVPKKSGGKVEGNKLRTCVDGRPVNKVCKGAEYNLPTAEQMFKKVQGYQIFSEFDIASAFIQIPMSEEAGLAYGFVAPNGEHYMWVRMAFGVKGACTHYQYQAERAVFECLDFTVVYVDNNLVYSNDEQEHIEQCKKVVSCFLTLVYG